MTERDETLERLLRQALSLLTSAPTSEAHVVGSGTVTIRDGESIPLPLGTTFAIFEPATPTPALLAERLLDRWESPECGHERDEAYGYCALGRNQEIWESRECLRALIAEALEQAALEAVAKYARTVDNPHRAHLHYDGCPFKPFADLASWEQPESTPACTCAEAHLGAYWKGQHLLERGYHDLTKKKLRDVITAALEANGDEREIILERALDPPSDK